VNGELDGCGRMRSRLNFRYYPGIFLEKPRKTIKILNQDIQSPGRDFNLEPSEYKAGMLTTRSQRLVCMWGNSRRKVTNI
jgi:hypothetical protein